MRQKYFLFISRSVLQVTLINTSHQTWTRWHTCNYLGPMLDPQKKLSILATNHRGEESGKNTYIEISHTSEAFTIESAIKKKNVDGLEK